MKTIRVPALLYILVLFMSVSLEVQANSTGLPSSQRSNLPFANALSEADLQIERVLNTAPDGAKTGTPKAGEGQAKAVVNLFGSVRNNFGSPVCGLILANGNFRFSCEPVGSYSFDTSQDASGQVTLFGFADGHFPYRTNFSASGRYDITLNYAGTVNPPPPPPPPPPSTNSTINFTITDGCNNGIRIEYKFYDFGNSLVWPSSTTHYFTTAFNDTNSHNLSCRTGGNVCFGARTTGLYWGVDLDGSKSCLDCCITCQQGNSLSRRLTC